MRYRAVASCLILSGTLLSCESVYVYDYELGASPNAESDMEFIATRLAHVLEPQGFAKLALGNETPPQVGATGYRGCPNASNLVVFLRERSGRTSVHFYTCQGEARVVTLADSWVPDEPARTSDLLSREFAAELAAGTMVLQHRRRLALE